MFNNKLNAGVYPASLTALEIKTEFFKYKPLSQHTGTTRARTGAETLALPLT